MGHFIFHQHQSLRPWSETRRKSELLKSGDRVQIKVWCLIPKSWSETDGAFHWEFSSGSLSMPAFSPFSNGTLA